MYVVVSNSKLCYLSKVRKFENSSVPPSKFYWAFVSGLSDDHKTYEHNNNTWCEVFFVFVAKSALLLADARLDLERSEYCTLQ